jgi:AmpE protein
VSFIVIVVVFGLVQYWGSTQVFQRDGSYLEWIETTRAWFPSDAAQLLAQVLLPVVLLWCALGVIESISGLLLFLVSIPLLMFSLGRGDFQEWLKGYSEASHRNDNEVATEYASRLGVNAEDISGWPDLHRQTLRKAGYLGFERWFTAIFWFVLLGPLGAVFYRLTAIAGRANDQSEGVRDLALRLLWLLEWPVVRLLGLSFALTGNFAGCIHNWKECLLCLQRPTEGVMEHYIHGALNVNGEEITQEEITEQELDALTPLFTRSLILWLCVLAVLTIV